MSHNHQNNVELEYIDDEQHDHGDHDHERLVQQHQQQQQQSMVTMKRISRGYNKRKFSHNREHREIRELRELPVDHVQHPQLTMPQNVVALAMGQRQVTISKRSSPRSPMGTKTKKKK